jgi:hypothetical protein
MNSYNYSYNVLINRLEAFAAGHLLIKRFTHGQIDLADMDQDEQYPFMHVVPNNIKPVDGGMQFDFQIIFADIPRDKETKAEYQREVISDCVRLAQDLIAEVKNGLALFGFDVQLVTPPVIEPFMEEYKNTLTGVTFSLQLEVPWDWSACDIPAVWAVGGSSSGGSGSPIGIVLRTNGVDNAVQNILDLVAGTNITITDNGDGSVTFDAAGGGGGGGGPYVSTEFNANHATALGNQYVIGDRVWYNGSVYACIANNDGINPTNPAYWTLQAVGFRLRQTPVDWNASSGDYQILNKPTLATVATTGDYNDLINTPVIPSPQGLQDVITTDNVLNTDNTIDCDSNSLIIDDTANFEVNSTSKLSINVNGTAEVTLDTQSVLLSESSGTNVQQVIVDTAKVKMQSGFALNGITSIATEPTAIKIITPAVFANTATVGQVLSLSNASSGQVEFTTLPASGTVTSVGLTMPAPSNAAFTVSGSPVTTSGTLAVAANGTNDQYIDGTGALRTFPSTGGGGGQIFYFNGNISQGTIGGNDYYELGTAANTGPAANFTRATTGAIARFITDVGSPNHTIIPAGVWTIDVYLSETGGGANHAEILAKLYTYNGSTFTLIATSTVEEITNGNVPDLYSFTISVPSTVTLATDRVHIEFDIQNTNGKTVTLYTEDGKIGEVHTTYAIGLSSLNGLTENTQNFAVGTSGTDFAISSAGSTHTFNLPTASATNRGALSSADWSTFNAKEPAIAAGTTSQYYRGDKTFQTHNIASITDSTTVGQNLVKLANPSAITYLRINADNTISALTLAQLKSDLSISTAILAATFTTVGTGFETVTDLSFAVTANKTYKWRATLNHFNATSASTFSITGPASPTFNVYRFTASNAATTNAVFNGTVYDAGTNAAFSSNGVTTADGMIRVISNGTVSIRIRSAAGGGISLRAGSILEFEEVL